MNTLIGMEQEMLAVSPVYFESSRLHIFSPAILLPTLTLTPTFLDWEFEENKRRVGSYNFLFDLAPFVLDLVLSRW